MSGGERREDGGPTMSVRQYETLIRAGLSMQNVREWPRKSLWLTYADHVAGVPRAHTNTPHSPAGAAWEFMRRLFPKQVAEMEAEMDSAVMRLLKGSQQ